MDRPGRHGRPAHAGARRYRPLVTPLGHQIEAALAAGTMPGNEIRERIFPSAIRGGMGLLLRTKRHTATGKQIQVLVAAVNRHMPATPSRCCRRRRGRTRSTFPGGNPGPRAMIPHLPPRPPTSSGSTWRGHGRASTAAMTWSLVGVVTWFLPRNRNEGRRAVESSQCRGKASANFAHRGRFYRARSRGTLRHCGALRTRHANDESTAIEHRGR
jgi:hypothetical protein